jgi:gamma-glutamyltranspeptidase
MNRNTTNTDIEVPIPGVTLDYDTAAFKAALEVGGHRFEVIAQTSGLPAILVAEDGSLIGGADFRRDGTADGGDLPPGQRK